MIGILETVPAPFQSVPTIFPRTYCNAVENDGGFSDDFLTFLKLIKGAVSRNSAKLGNYKMPVKLRET